MMKIVLGILLGILKGVGWILVGLLILIIVILLIVLFMPIRYQAEGEFDTSVKAHVRVTWLLRLIQADVDFQDKKLNVSYRLLWIHRKLLPKEQVEQVERKEPANAPKQSKKPKLESTVSVEAEDPVFEEAVVQEEAKGGVIEKITVIGAKLKNQILRILDKVRSIIHNVENWKTKIENGIYRFQTYPGKSELIQLVKNELLYIIRGIRPRKFRLQLQIGFDDPSRTGQCMAVYGIMTSLWGCKGYSLDVNPDFENKILQGNVDLKGRIALYAIGFPAVRIILNKRVRKLIRDIKNIKEGF